MADEVVTDKGREPEETTAAAQAEAEDGAQAEAGLRREAASHRRKAREAEAERDKLAGRLEALQRGEVERIAAAPGDDRRGLASAADLWRMDGVELAGLLDEDGNVDREKVVDAVQRIGEQRPHWLRRPSAGNVDQGRGRPVEPARAGFGAALKGGAR